jgi:hypothetical protein
MAVGATIVVSLDDSRLDAVSDNTLQLLHYKELIWLRRYKLRAGTTVAEFDGTPPEFEWPVLVNVLKELEQ